MRHQAPGLSHVEAGVVVVHRLFDELIDVERPRQVPAMESVAEHGVDGIRLWALVPARSWRDGRSQSLYEPIRQSLLAEPFSDAVHEHLGRKPAASLGVDAHPLAEDPSQGVEQRQVRWCRERGTGTDQKQPSRFRGSAVACQRLGSVAPVTRTVSRTGRVRCAL